MSGEEQRGGCLGVVTANTTRSDLLRAGVTPKDADKILAFRDMLVARSQPIEPEVKGVLYENLWNLYESGDTTSREGPAEEG